VRFRTPGKNARFHDGLISTLKARQINMVPQDSLHPSCNEGPSTGAAHSATHTATHTVAHTTTHTNIAEFLMCRNGFQEILRGAGWRRCIGCLIFIGHFCKQPYNKCLFCGKRPILCIFATLYPTTNSIVVDPMQYSCVYT